MSKILNSMYEINSISYRQLMLSLLAKTPMLFVYNCLVPLIMKPVRRQQKCFMRKCIML